MNKALLAKRGWQPCSKSDSLWSNILKAKYLTNGIFLQAEKKNDSFYTWKSILSAQDCVKKGVVFLVRNGASTRFWLDTWIGMEPLITKATANVPDCDQHLKVNQYWHNNS